MYVYQWLGCIVDVQVAGDKSQSSSPWACLMFIFVYVETYEKRQANNIFWSPNGQFCVLAGLRR